MYDESCSAINPSSLQALRDIEEEDDIERPTQFGYPEYQQRFDGNPFSNKIILMDEVHNLISPSSDILKSSKRAAAVERLRLMLHTATNSVLVRSRMHACTC